MRTKSKRTVIPTEKASVEGYPGHNALKSEVFTFENDEIPSDCETEFPPSPVTPDNIYSETIQDGVDDFISDFGNDFFGNPVSPVILRKDELSFDGEPLSPLPKTPIL